MFFTLGSLASLASTMFLVGPMKQLKNIFTKQRMAATLTYVLSMILTLYTALSVRWMVRGCAERALCWAFSARVCCGCVAC